MFRKTTFMLALGLAISANAMANDTPFIGKEGRSVIGHIVSAKDLKNPSIIYVAKALHQANENSIFVEKDSSLSSNRIYAGFAEQSESDKDLNRSVQANANTIQYNGTLTSSALLYSGYASSKHVVENFALSANNNNLIIGESADIQSASVLAAAGAAIQNGTITTNNNTINLINGRKAVKATYIVGAYIQGWATGEADKAKVNFEANDNTILIDRAVRSSNRITAVLISPKGDHTATTFSGVAKNNTVKILDNGNVKNQKVYLAYTDAQLSKNSAFTVADGNIYIAKKADVTNARFNAFDTQSTVHNVTFVNNTITIEGKHNIATVANFQNVNIRLTARDFKPVARTFAAGAPSGAVQIAKTDFTKDTNIHIDIVGGSTLAKDTSVVYFGNVAKGTTMRVTDGFVDLGNVAAEGQVTLSGTTQASQESTILTSALAANATFLQQGTDLLLAHDFKDGAFVTLGGGQTEYDVADLSVDGYNTAFGYSFGLNNSNVAAFVEYADGSYDATLGTKAEGDTSYYGVGLFGRHALQNGLTGTMSVRFGRAEGDFASTMIGDLVRFDTESNYVTAHVGAEYAVKLSDSLTVSPFAQYRFARIGSDNVSAKGHNVELESFTSHRTLVGAAMSGALSSAANYRVSLAWEHEFDGEGNARQDGLALQTLDLGGDAAVIDASVHCAPSTLQGWDFGVGIQGRMGDSEGIAGRFTTTYRF